MPVMTQAQPVLQGLAPLLNADTRLVVLGSFPGVASLRAQQYYGHPYNQFWKIVTTLLATDPTAVMAWSYAERAHWLLSRGVGLWDVYASLVVIAHNGGESFKHAKLTRALGLPVYRLPSTSPANASWSFQRKLDAWREVFQTAGLL